MEILNPGVEKLIRKSSHSKTRIYNLANTINKTQSILGITNSKNLVKSNKQLSYQIKQSNQSKESYVSRLGLDKVSDKPLPQYPTKIDKANLAILQPGNSEIPQMQLHHNLHSHSQVIHNTGNMKGGLRIKSKTLKTIKKDKTDKTDYIIVIPSYNRPETIQKKTLALLHRHMIRPEYIYIFVANESQREIYEKQIPKELYGKIIVGVLGLRNQRNFIMEYFPEGTNLVQMDDDLEKIMELVKISNSQNKKNNLEANLESKLENTLEYDKMSDIRKSLRGMRPISDLDRFIRKAFEICKDRGIYLWGVYPLANSRFMSPKMTTDLRFIVGPMWGTINRHRPELKLTIDEKENAERTLQYYSLDGAVLRFNNIGIETRYYTNKGGMQNEGKDRKVEAMKSAEYLHRKYPKLTKLYLGKKSGIPEIKMITNIHKQK